MMKSSGIAVLALSVAACGGAPRTAAGRISLEQRARTTVSEMQARDPSLSVVLASAYAYAVFPTVGKGGAIVGGAFGRGILFERGEPSGYVELAQASIGAQLGGETFSELIVLRDPHDVRQIKAGTFDLGAKASAVVLTAGAASATGIGPDRNPVFLLPRGGLMVDISVSGQRLDYRPFLDKAAG